MGGVEKLRNPRPPPPPPDPGRSETSDKMSRQIAEEGSGRSGEDEPCRVRLPRRGEGRSGDEQSLRGHNRHERIQRRGHGMSRYTHGGEWR